MGNGSLRLASVQADAAAVAIDAGLSDIKTNT